MKSDDYYLLCQHNDASIQPSGLWKKPKNKKSFSNEAHQEVQTVIP
jgi:hypothetical protein